MTGRSMAYSRNSPERIMQNGKKKLVLDHLIVQKMDDDASEDVQSILTFGAQALFQEGGYQTEREIHCQFFFILPLQFLAFLIGSLDSENDIDKLIEKTETEGEAESSGSGENAAFSFAKIWSADKDELEDLETDNAEREAQDDAWAKTLQKIAEERAKEEAVEVSGRGTRRKAAPVFPQVRGQSFVDVIHDD